METKRQFTRPTMSTKTRTMMLRFVHFLTFLVVLANSSFIMECHDDKLCEGEATESKLIAGCTKMTNASQAFTFNGTTLTTFSDDDCTAIMARTSEAYEFGKVVCTSTIPGSAIAPCGDGQPYYKIVNPDAAAPLTCPAAGDEAYSSKPALDALNNAACFDVNAVEFTAFATKDSCTLYCASCEASVCGIDVTCSDPSKCTMCADPPGCADMSGGGTSFAATGTFSGVLAIVLAARMICF